MALKKNRAPSYTLVARETVLQQMRADPRVAVITAAMCQGTMLEPVREEFPQRFFDVGICESHAVAFAAGLAKAGMRPLVDIYSTFMQRAYDQIFQEVALQNLPVTLLLDRAGLVGPDGPTHHGVFDLTYLRPLPNLVVMAPGDQQDLARMIEWSLRYDGPTAIRYPKAAGRDGRRAPWPPWNPARAEVLRWGADGMLVACGTVLRACVAGGRPPGQGRPASRRHQRPLRQTAGPPTMLRAVRECPLVVTVEEGALMGGFGSAVLEAAADAGLDAGRIHRLGIPDQFIEHGDRSELLAGLGLDAQGIARSLPRSWPAAKPRCRAAGRQSFTPAPSARPDSPP